ncbi:DUF3426 domain-containing protein [Roseospira visakhapatnamensis]|uniref:Putative Zn finger-like uncharacterized protein n=1 Tax=Roseospira visakhapatnamensis TaxID=390880 RepID=A0A7W6RD10_9PROT|nr:DUF3426 domain-containing protein [Roseospira visakhapatnamensis]MBB4266321.1 putative Zn finger-like uncharacterized protein [Roseospira visakhapatnamensis]
MKINCPNCETGFSLPDTALGPRGRRLKCVRCGHVWHQEPSGENGLTADTTASVAASLEALSAPSRATPARGPLSSHLESDGAAPASAIDPIGPPDEDDPLVEPRAAADPMPARDDAFDPMLDPLTDDIPMNSEPDRPRRGPPAEDEGPEPDLDDILARLGEQERERSRRGDPMDPESLDDAFDLDDDAEREALPGILRTQLKAQRRGFRPPSWASAVIVVVVLLAGIAGGAYLGRNTLVGVWPAAEAWYDAVGIPLTRPGLGLSLEQVVPTRELVDGNDVLVVRGLVTNVSEKIRPVPALHLELNDDDGALVQQMVSPPPADSLAPGETAPFRMTVENRLPEATVFEVGFTDRPPEPVMAPATPAPVSDGTANDAAPPAQ